MQTKTFFLSLILCLPGWLLAQTSVVRGVVLDQQSESPLIGATVQCISLGAEAPALGATTDVNGAFVIRNVPAGRQNFEVRYLGYEQQTLTNVLVTAGKESVLEVRLQESFTKMKEVVITAGSDKDRPINEMAALSARPFNTEEVLRYSGGRNDVAKMVASFAGVAANNDARNDIVIRGNSPTGVLWRMDGIPIPNPNHFSTLGTTGGPVSALNPNLISNSDFLTGAFPAEYGNALAGVFDVNLRSGNRERWEYTAQLGAFSGLEALVEGPLNPKTGASVVAAYRHSFVELADVVGLKFGTNALPRYKDLSFKVDLGNSKAGQFSVFGIGALSSIDFIGAELDTTDLFSSPNQNAYNTSRFGVLGLRHNILFGDNAYWRTVVSASYSGETYQSEDISRLENDAAFQLVDVKNDLTAYRLSSYYNRKVSNRLTFRGGILLQHQQLDTYVSSRDATPDLNGDGVSDWWVQRDFDGAVDQGEAFAQAQYRLAEGLTLNGGLHALYFEKSNDFALEPRGAVSWQFLPRQRLSLGYGMHHQTQPLPVFFFREQLADGSTKAANTDLGFTRSQHLVLAYDVKPATDWRVKTEFYYQWLNRVPVDSFSSAFSMLNTGADFVFPEKYGLVNEGVGANLGAEFTLEKYFSHGYYGLVTLSVFDSKYKGSDGVERSTAFDGGYVMNVLAGKEFAIGKTGRRFITLDTKLTYAGGRPYTPVDLDASRAAGREILVDSEAFSLRQDDYFRWDVKIGFRANSPKKKFSQTVYLDFQNITNRENIFAMRYNPARGVVGRINQIGFFPDMLFRYEF